MQLIQSIQSIKKILLQRCWFAWLQMVNITFILQGLQQGQIVKPKKERKTRNKSATTKETNAIFSVRLRGHKYIAM